MPLAFTDLIPRAVNTLHFVSTVGAAVRIAPITVLAARTPHVQVPAALVEAGFPTDVGVIVVVVNAV